MANSSAAAADADIDRRNIAFWNELCGSVLAKSLGITDNGPASLKRFDDWYFDFYPYLHEHIPFESVTNEKVLEIGLGYGTVAQRLMEKGAQYHGLDIAGGPVEMAQHRAALIGAKTTIQQGSALEIPYVERYFDTIVTIGCLHHTGNLPRALNEVHRCLRESGRVTIMLYSALSYRQWLSNPKGTMHRLKNPDFNWTNADTSMRRAYDASVGGAAAPETTFVAAQELKKFLSGRFRSVTITPRNIGADFLPARLLPRSLANALFERWLGLDLYIECVR